MAVRRSGRVTVVTGFQSDEQKGWHPRRDQVGGVGMVLRVQRLQGHCHNRDHVLLPLHFQSVGRRGTHGRGQVEDPKARIAEQRRERGRLGPRLGRIMDWNFGQWWRWRWRYVRVRVSCRRGGRSGERSCGCEGSRGGRFSYWLFRGRKRRRRGRRRLSLAGRRRRHDGWWVKSRCVRVMSPALGYGRHKRTMVKWKKKICGL